MDMASVLKSTANLLVGVSLVKLIAADLAAGIRHSPYGAAVTAAALGAVTGMALAHRRPPRIIPTRF